MYAPVCLFILFLLFRSFWWKCPYFDAAEAEAEAAAVDVCNCVFATSTGLTNEMPMAPAIPPDISLSKNVGAAGFYHTRLKRRKETRNKKKQ